MALTPLFVFLCFWYFCCFFCVVDAAAVHCCILNRPCPNRVSGQVDNADRFLPTQTSPAAMDQYEFVGKLMGIALRTKNYLEFQYAPIVWKLLVGQVPTEHDIMMVDTTAMNHLKRVRSWDDESTFSSLFDEFDDNKVPCFTVINANGETVDVIENGSNIPLTYSNRKYYVEKAIEYRCHEFDGQCLTIQRGLTSIVPHRALQLFTGVELEILICGDAKIEVAQLQLDMT